MQGTFQNTTYAPGDDVTITVVPGKTKPKKITVHFSHESGLVLFLTPAIAEKLAFDIVQMLKELGEVQ